MIKWINLSGHLYGDFSDADQLACSIQMDSDGKHIRLGQRYVWSNNVDVITSDEKLGKLLKLQQMKLSQQEAKQLRDVLDHFIQDGNLSHFSNQAAAK